MRVAVDGEVREDHYARVVGGLLDDLERCRERRSILKVQLAEIDDEEASLRELLLGTLQETNNDRLVGERVTVSLVRTRKEVVVDEELMLTELARHDLLDGCMQLSAPKARKAALEAGLGGVEAHYEEAVRVSWKGG